jgi:hypothetical protein
MKIRSKNMKNKREDSSFGEKLLVKINQRRTIKSANFEAIKLASKIRDQAFEMKFHHGKPSLPSEFKKLRNLVDKMENLLKE